MNSPVASVLTILREQRRLLAATAAILFTGWLGDFLLWGQEPGISVGLFVAVLGLAVWLGSPPTRRGSIALLLLLASAVQSAIELCFTNVVCLGVFSLAVAAETYYPGLPGLWARWSVGLFAAMTAPFRWVGLLVAWAELRLLSRYREGGGAISVSQIILSVIPAALIAVVFAILLGAGNAVFAEMFARIGRILPAYLREISLVRTLLWPLWLIIGVAFFWPLASTALSRFWVRTIPRLERNNTLLALWQSALVLIAVNGLFFAANTIDVVYLWADAKLPAGVNASQFVHSGVYALIAATVLAAGLLAVIFQQQPTVAHSFWLRVLALLWIAQNILLIAGVFRRLALYVDAYQLSELRVYVGCFLLLVSTGFILLARHVWLGTPFEKLLFRNCLATLTLFFVMQFCDVGTWVAHWNVTQWRERSGHVLDVKYLARLGPRGWPALQEVARPVSTDPIEADAWQALGKIVARERQRTEPRDWRSYQARYQHRVDALLHAYPAPVN